MIPRLALRSALDDDQLLGAVLSGESWEAWRTLLIAAMGEPLTEQERALFKDLTGGREQEPSQPVEELAAIVGRRGGKSRAISVLATYIAALCEHPALVRGERGVVLIIAPDTKQAEIVLDYTEANFRASPILAQLVENRRERQLRLTNRVTIEVRASDFRTLRGPTYIAVIADETAFWFNENSANPDHEILDAVRPGLATTFGPLFMISSPYARRGELWRTYQRHYGPQGDPLILVAQGSSRTFNPTLAQSVVDRALARDQSAATAEYLAEFRSDIESFVRQEAVEACVVRGLYERPPVRSVQYSAFTDPSGGSQDSFSLAIGHFDWSRKIVVVDALRETRPPFNPAEVVDQYARLLHSYQCRKLFGDKYAGIWPVEAFSRHSITYEQSAKPKSDLYIDLLPLLNSGQIHLLDHSKCVNQIITLERRTSRAGRDSIDHPPGGAHDDLANAIAGLAWTLSSQPSLNYSGYLERTPDDPDGVKSWQQLRQYMYLQSGGTFRLW
jgi:hypothetical protein